MKKKVDFIVFNFFPFLHPFVFLAFLFFKSNESTHEPTHLTHQPEVGRAELYSWLTKKVSQPNWLVLLFSQSVMSQPGINRVDLH